MNEAVANALERYGKLLEISGENAFRARAFARAAESVRHLPGPLAEIHRHGKLRQIEGVGPGIAAFLELLLGEGEERAFAELGRTTPATLLEIAAIPGVGAKTVARLYKELGVVDLTGLEAALDAGRVRALAGFSEKSERKIIDGIAALRRRSGRHRLGDALPQARALVAALHGRLPAGTAVSLAGSVRRRDETVADIDLVIGGASLDRVIAAASESAVIAPEFTVDGDRIAGALATGIRFEIVLTPLDHFGSSLIAATGSSAHLQDLGAIPGGSTEEAVYAMLGLPWIPPELRQGLDEFAMARAGRLDEIVTVADVRGEFHCHTTWSDGALPVAETARAAREHGYAFLGISDHTRSLGVANGLDLERLRAQNREIDRIAPTAGIRLFASAEVEVARDGRLDFDDDTLAALDIVIASTHVGLRQSRAELTARLLGVLDNRHVDIIAHPSGRLIEQREGGDFDWDAVFARAATTGTALEINADPARMDLSATHARQALAAGCLLTINCDAHHPDGWRLLEYGIANARKAGARPAQILNCWPLDRIEAWLADRR